MWNEEKSGLALDGAIRAYLGSEVDLSGTYVMGGFIRAFMAGEKPVDMDLFFLNKGEFGRVKSILLSSAFTPVADTENALTLIREYTGSVIQLCKAPMGDVGEILGTFDFTVTQAAVSDGSLWTHPDFYKDLAARRLVYNAKAKTPALNRLAKYVAKGYTISNAECLAMAIGVHKYEVRSGGSD